MSASPLLAAPALASRRLEADDLPWATALLTQAAAGHPALRYLAADAGPPARWLLSWLLALTLHHGSVYTNAARTALALWLGPEQGAFRRGLLLGRLLAGWHLGWAGSRRLRRLLRTTDWLRRQLMAGPHHWLLAVVVHPQARHRGEGRRLLQATLALRQAPRLPCCFSTQIPGQLAFYQGLGFELRGHCPVGEGPAGPLSTWALLRPAS